MAYLSFLRWFLNPAVGTWIGAASALLGAVSALSNSGSQGAPPGGSGFMYLPQAQPTADINFQQLMGTNQQVGTGMQQQIDPLLQSYLSGATQQAPGIQQAGQQQSGQYGNLAGLAGLYSQLTGGAGLNTLGQAQQMFGQGSNILNMGLDPQQAFYQQSLQDLTGQVNAQQALRGLGTSGTGLQDIGDVLSRFNIDWANSQLGRAATGAQAASSLYGQGLRGTDVGGQALTNSLTLGGLQPAYTMQGATSPLQALQASLVSPASTYGQAIQQLELSPFMSLQTPLLNYMGLGSQAGNLANNYALNNQAQQNALFQQGLGNLAGMGNYLSQINWNQQTPYNPQFSYDQGQTPMYTGYDISGGPAYG